jgi:MFS family permease
MVALLAIPWFVLETTGSAALTGVTAAVTVLPTILSGALGGVLVDRIGHRRTSVLADIASALSVAAIPLLHVTAGIAVWQLLVLVFLGALLDLPAGTARSSLVPEFAERAGMPLERANSMMSAIQQGGQLAGPLIAGALIATVGATAALWFDAATFVIAAGLVAAFVPRPERTAPIERATYVEQLRRGARFLRDDRLVRFILVTIAITNWLVSPIFAVALPIYANQVLESAIAFGILSASLGAGALAGAITYGAFGHRLPRRAIFVAALTTAGAPLALLAFTDEVVVGAAVLAFVGFSAAPLNPLIITLIQERTPPHMRAQVIGAAIALAWIAMPVGMLMAGALAEAFGVRVLFIAVGASFVIVLGVVLRLPVLRDLDRSPRAAPGPPR